MSGTKSRGHRYLCLTCGYVYDERRGAPEHGTPAGTQWSDLPLSWRCPDCGASKDEFEPTDDEDD
jgi:rubredoxin